MSKLTDLNIIEAAQHKDLFGPWFKKRFFQKREVGTAGPPYCVPCSVMS